MHFIIIEVHLQTIASLHKATKNLHFCDCKVIFDYLITHMYEQYDVFFCSRAALRQQVSHQ